MRRRSVDSLVEREFLKAMITSNEFLAAISPELDPRMFDPGPMKIISQWCLDYAQSYNKAPGQAIESIYHSWAELNEPENSEEEPVHDILSDLSDEYDRKGEDVNVGYLIDSFAQYVSLRRLESVKDRIEAALSQGDVERGAEAVLGYYPTSIGVGCGIDVLNDVEAYRRAFALPIDPLISFPGDAGVFFSPALTREGLIAIQGPEKRGKTMWCVEMALRALRGRKKVALFETGDLTESQIMKRLGVRLARTPLWPSQCGKISVPVKIETGISASGFREAVVTWRTGRFPHAASLRRSVKAARAFRRHCGLPKNKPSILVSVHPTATINVAGIRSILKQWELQRQFVPDVVIIDYADILAPEPGQSDFRHQVNETWKALRRLSQELHCLVLVPTQSDAASYKQRVLTMSNFSEDKRKLAHVTGMLGLNQTEEEKNEGVMRLNWIVLREHEYDTHRCLFVAQCPVLGRAFCCGSF